MMTIELVTGHAGAAHVSSSDVGEFNAGIIGSGKYVLDTGSMFAANVQSANAITIGTGDAVFEGRHVRISSAETVSIDNGAQGLNRNDIICIKYQLSGGIESASLIVVKGAAAATAVDPTIPSGSILAGSNTAYMPLYRVPINGITVGTPVKLFGDVLTPISEPMDVNKIPGLPASKITSGALPIERGGSGASAIVKSELASGVMFYRFGPVCIVTVDKVVDLSGSWISVTLASVPSDARPSQEVRNIGIVANTGGLTAGISITTGGEIRVSGYGGAPLGSQPVIGSVVWFVKE